MAYFPEEQAVRFIGQNCAAKHFGELYAEADERFKVEARCRQLVANWAALLERREGLHSFIDEAMPVADGLHPELLNMMTRRRLGPKLSVRWKGALRETNLCCLASLPQTTIRYLGAFCHSLTHADEPGPA